MNLRDFARTVVTLLDKGYMPYPCQVPRDVYEAQRCTAPARAVWFVRPASEAHKMTRFHCLGCRKRCVLVDPQGFQAVLPMRTRPAPVALVEAQQLTALELVRLGRPLRVAEAAWVLNVSDSQMYEWIDEGMLERVPGTPLRVTPESVQRLLQPES